nr:MAG TPA: hypothetical protein [Caudoviricetes sp.]
MFFQQSASANIHLCQHTASLHVLSLHFLSVQCQKLHSCQEF